MPFSILCLQMLKKFKWLPLLDSLNTPTHAGNIYTDTYTKILKQSLSKDSNSKTCAVRWELEIKVKNQCHLFGTISSENSSLQMTTYLNLIYSWTKYHHQINNYKLMCLPVRFSKCSTVASSFLAPFPLRALLKMNKQINKWIIFHAFVVLFYLFFFF